MTFDFSLDDRNRVDFPDCHYLKANSDGPVSAYLLSSCRCNLNALYVYFPAAINANTWLHIFDINTNELADVSGKYPSVPPVKVIAAGNFVWMPPLDVTIFDRKIMLKLGFPFDKGIYIVLSSTELTCTPSSETAMITGRIFTGNAGKIE